MVPLTMATKEDDFVIDVLATSEIQSIDVVRELLPLSEGSITLIIGRISAIDQPKIGCRL